MNESLIIVILSGASGAAIIKLVDGIIQHFLQRRAKKIDDNDIKKNKLENKVDVLTGCMMIMMLDRIQFLCEKYLSDGEIDIDALRRLHIMHDRYHAVGGNGDLDNLMSRVDNLRLK